MKKTKTSFKKKKLKKKQLKPTEKFKYKNTLLLSIFLIIIYSLLSTSFLYIPTKTLLLLGFNWSNLIGLFTYSFIHISPMHLIGNLILLLAVGFTAEQKLSSKEYFSVYITAGVASALVYGSLFPQNYLVGASAAISSLLAIAFIIDIKKTLVAIAVAALIISIISPQVQAYTLTKYNELHNQQTQLQKQIQEINQQIAVAQKENNTQQEQKLNKTKVEQVSKFNQTSNKALTVDEGIKREKHAQTSLLVHLTGAFIGLAYLFLFRRELIWQLPSQILPQDWLHKNLKKK